MSDWTPTDEQVEQAADAIHKDGLWDLGYWERVRLARAVLVAVGPHIAAQALSEAAEGMRSAKDYGHWNLRSEDDPEAAYSPDVWVDRRAARIEKEAGR
jgi:hypothetical protein